VIASPAVVVAIPKEILTRVDEPMWLGDKSMRMIQSRAALVVATMFALICGIAVAGGKTDGSGPTIATKSASQPVDPSAIPAEGIMLAPSLKSADPCTQGEVISSPSRPNWDGGAGTTQCGIIETDFGWLGQPMGRGVRQWMLMSSMRYGLTPRLEVRWGLINHMAQSGGGEPSLVGVGDQCVSAEFRFVEQGRMMPALALSYGVKIPTANPAKGFGTGFTDDQLVFIASRDLGRNHLDFNIAGIVTGEPGGHDGAAQFGLALTRQITRKLSWILESYGGPQPGTTDRYGAGLTGVSFALRPWLVLDGAYVKAFTGGAPRQQILFGFTVASRPTFGPIPRGSRFAHLLGR